jgi:DNA polymerase-1
MCPLAKDRNRVVTPYGPSDARILFIGESPGIDEDRSGTPFVGNTGYETDWLLACNGIKRDWLFMDNLIRCHPPDNRDPHEDEVQSCSVWTMMVLDYLAHLELIVSVGRFSSRFFLGDVDMERSHGLPIVMPESRWNELTNKFRKPPVVLPVIHPAAGLHSTDTMLLVQGDFGTFGGLLKGQISVRQHEYDFDEYPEPDYALVTDDYYMWQMSDLYDYPKVIAIDTEWAREDPWCLSYSSLPGTARVIKAANHHGIGMLNQHVSQPDVITVLHNALYDVPVLDKMGIRIANPRDTMVMAYLLPGEPQGLKALAYRHCGMQMNDYSDMVGGVSEEFAIEYLIQASEHAWPDPEQVLVWDKGQPRVKQPQNIGRKIKRILSDYSSKDSVDPRKRWTNIGYYEGRSMVEEVLGPMPEGWLSDIPLIDAVHYSARDADATIRVYPILWQMLLATGMRETFERDMGIIPMVVDMMKAGIKPNVEALKRLSDEFADRMEEEAIKVTSYAKDSTLRLNPNSSPQMANLLFNEIGLKPIKKGKSGEPSTDTKVLARLEDKHPVVPHIIQYRSYSTLKQKFADILPTKINPQTGRIHSTFRTTRVDTGRLSSSDPNLMAQPVRTAEGRRIRECFEARDGMHAITSKDYSQVEMRVTAHCSQDKRLIQIFRSGQDIHSITASTMFGIPISRLDEMKHRYPAKRVGFGVLNDLSPQGLQREMVVGGAKESDWPIDRCEELINGWFDVYSGVRRWMDENRRHALRYGFVRDMHGRIRYIPGAKARSHYIQQDALRKAGNAPIQMGAQGIIKEAMVQLTPVYRSLWAEHPEIEPYEVLAPLIQIHDDLVDECWLVVLEDWMRMSKCIMETCVKLSVPLVVDQKVGENWGTMMKVIWETNGMMRLK